LPCGYLRTDDRLTRALRCASWKVLPTGDAHPHLTDGFRYKNNLPTSIQLSRSSDPKHVTITP
jgi:hypothetical protein